MNLYNEIMNVTCCAIPPSIYGPGNVNSNPYMAYKEGHLDALKSAAKLSLKTTTRIEELEHYLKIMIFQAEDFAQQLQNVCEGFEEEEEFPLSDEISEFEELVREAKSILKGEVI